MKNLIRCIAALLVLSTLAGMTIAGGYDNEGTGVPGVVAPAPPAPAAGGCGC